MAVRNRVSATHNVKRDMLLAALERERESGAVHRGRSRPVTSQPVESSPPAPSARAGDRSTRRNRGQSSTSQMVGAVAAVAR